MTMRGCPNCGGVHFGSHRCPFINEPCIVCGDPTILACSDCAIDSAGKVSVHVCKKAICRDQHELVHARSIAEAILSASPPDLKED